MGKRSNLIVIIICLVLLCKVASAGDTTRIYFDIDKKDLSHFTQTLDSITQVKDIVKISVVGYTDFLGTDVYNLNLSQQRAEAVKKYLSGKLSAISITAIGKGELPSFVEMPLGERKHRRVDIIVTRKGQKTDHIAENTSKQEKEKRTIEDIGKMKVGETIVLGSLNFIGGRHFLLPQSEPLLRDLYKVMKENPGLKIEIQGHVCCTLDRDGYDYDTHDSLLSLNRAKYIYQRLIEMGIEKSRLRYIGYGSRFPKIWPEITDEDKSANRRVEVRILEK